MFARAGKDDGRLFQIQSVDQLPYSAGTSLTGENDRVIFGRVHAVLDDFARFLSENKQTRRAINTRLICVALERDIFVTSRLSRSCANTR